MDLIDRVNTHAFKHFYVLSVQLSGEAAYKNRQSYFFHLHVIAEGYAHWTTI